MDTNPVENAIRPVALTRKNALFAGHEVGAGNWALLASIVATCKLNDVNPVDYIADTLRAILDGHPQSRIDELMPWRFQKSSSWRATGEHDLFGMLGRRTWIRSRRGEVDVADAVSSTLVCGSPACRRNLASRPVRSGCLRPISQHIYVLDSAAVAVRPPFAMAPFPAGARPVALNHSGHSPAVVTICSDPSLGHARKLGLDRAGRLTDPLPARAAPDHTSSMNLFRFISGPSLWSGFRQPVAVRQRGSVRRCSGIVMPFPEVGATGTQDYESAGRSNSPNFQAT